MRQGGLGPPYPSRCSPASPSPASQYSSEIEQPSFDPGLTQKFSGRLRRFINKDGSFNVRRQGATWRATHPYLHLINMSWPTFLATVFVSYLAMNTLFAAAYFIVGV